MPTPRQTVRDYWITKLRTITPANGYTNNVQLADIRRAGQAVVWDLNSTQYPAILITQEEDRPYGDLDTIGDNLGNTYFREWRLRLHLATKNFTTPIESEDAGETLIQDVLRCLNLNRGVNPITNPVRVDEIEPVEFERLENHRAEIEMVIAVRYGLPVSDLD